MIEWVRRVLTPHPHPEGPPEPEGQDDDLYERIMRELDHLGRELDKDASVIRRRRDVRNVARAEEDHD